MLRETRLPFARTLGEVGTLSNEQHLNSLNRFRKQSARLVLEEHSHCEIPAGCGGVVLRWRNPQAALPVSIHLYSPVPATCWLDGAEVRLGRMDLAIGRHTLALAIEQVELSAGLLLFAANHDPTDYQRGEKTESLDHPLKVVSAADGTWRYSLASPPAEWVSLSFDDREWAALTLAPTPTLNRSEEGAYRCSHCVELGAACLGLPSGKHPKRGKVWIRKVFEAPAPKERPS
jgi:hypothetical protein